MRKIRKENRGGARPGTGPKLKYGEETVQVGFRCPKSKVKEFTKYARKFLKDLEKGQG